MPMGMGLQAWRVRAALEKRGIDPEAVDVEAHLDDSLTLTENLDNLRDTLGLSLSAKDEDERWRGWEHEGRERARDAWADPYAAAEERVPAQVTIMQAVAGPVVAWPVAWLDPSPVVLRLLRSTYYAKPCGCTSRDDGGRLCGAAPETVSVLLARRRRQANLLVAVCGAHAEKAPATWPRFSFAAVAHAIPERSRVAAGAA